MILCICIQYNARYGAVIFRTWVHYIRSLYYNNVIYYVHSYDAVWARIFTVAAYRRINCTTYALRCCREGGKPHCRLVPAAGPRGRCTKPRVYIIMIIIIRSIVRMWTNACIIIDNSTCGAGRRGWIIIIIIIIFF
jgi:hypothetical protein